MLPLLYIMVQGEVGHYRNQNVCFDVDFIAKRNVYLGSGIAQKGLDILLAERPEEAQ